VRQKTDVTRNGFKSVTIQCSSQTTNNCLHYPLRLNTMRTSHVITNSQMHSDKVQIYTIICSIIPKIYITVFASVKK